MPRKPRSCVLLLHLDRDLPRPGRTNALQLQAPSALRSAYQLTCIMLETRKHFSTFAEARQRECVWDESRKRSSTPLIAPKSTEIIELADLWVSCAHGSLAHDALQKHTGTCSSYILENVTYSLSAQAV